MLVQACSMLQSLVYTKFMTNKHAGRAYEKLNGAYFDGEFCTWMIFMETQFLIQF